MAYQVQLNMKAPLQSFIKGLLWQKFFKFKEIEGAISLDYDHDLVWGKPGHVFGPWLDGLLVHMVVRDAVAK